MCAFADSVAGIVGGFAHLVADIVRSVVDLVTGFLGGMSDLVAGVVCRVADLIAEILEKHTELKGVWHISSDPITKFDLLESLNREFAADVTIEPDDKVDLDRSLDSSRFRSATGYKPPAWDVMVSQMARDATIYESFS